MTIPEEAYGARFNRLEEWTYRKILEMAQKVWALEDEVKRIKESTDSLTDLYLRVTDLERR